MEVEKKLNKNKIFIFMILLLFILIVGSIFLMDRFKNAYLNVLVAPYGSLIKVDGKVINGSERFFPKQNVDVEISKEGFISKKIKINLESGKTTLLHEYLLDSNNGFMKYRKNIHDYDVLKLVADDKAKDFIYKTDKAMTIKEILPIEIADGLQVTTIRDVNSEETQKCETFLCVKIDGDNNNDKIRGLLKKYGYSYDDYSYIK